MYIKWIKCTIDSSNVDEFSIAQSKWLDIVFSVGFIAQFGGWNENNPCTAHVFGFWKDLTDYKNFMLRDHDRIFESTHQKGTYLSIDISFFNSDSDIVLFLNDLKAASRFSISKKLDETSISKIVLSDVRNQESIVLDNFKDGDVKQDKITIDLVASWGLFLSENE